MAYSKSTGRPSFRPNFKKKTFVKQDVNKLYGEDWNTISAYIRKRDDYKCMAHKINMKPCRNRFPPPFHGLIHVHHIIPLPRGNNKPSNLLALCRDCHGLTHNKNLGTISEKQLRATRKYRAY